ncbi:DUF6804 family protein [uncultured Porphyromonas sp.]|uniref:DUF6804 family protein n=1 Tax=uncultured Porphyromonas sp. TaxID=159274 RepID=UPI00261FD179|nr:DUF6804 family protein [uncultured Porphyromonas sp.]
MNNKSLYLVFALSALVLLFIERIHLPLVASICRVLICGGALYYVFRTYREKKSVTLLMCLMAVVGLFYNPVVPINVGEVIWIVAHVITLALFYFISLKTPIDDTLITRKEEEPKGES